MYNFIFKINFFTYMYVNGQISWAYNPLNLFLFYFYFYGNPLNLDYIYIYIYIYINIYISYLNELNIHKITINLWLF